ncbi:MAG: hypothetical protein GXO65_04165 [Euryarchaeota archaeon]|nr:hypothetical protein [Euryarchaeota archaeon]
MIKRPIILCVLLLLLEVSTVTAHVEEHQIQVNCTDALGIRNVTLVLTDPLGGVKNYPMYDDGKHADGLPGDSEYGVLFTISEDGQYTGEIICVDGVGHETRKYIKFYHNHILQEQHIEVFVTEKNTIIEQITFKTINFGQESIPFYMTYNFNLRNQIGLGNVRTPWEMKNNNWNSSNDFIVSNCSISPGDPMIIIFEGEFDAIDRTTTGDFILTSYAPIIRTSNLILGKNTYQIKIPKEKWWGFKKLQLLEINPPPDLLYDGGEYKVLQWLAPTQLAKDKYLFNIYVKYNYSLELLPIILGFVGMLIAIFVEKIFGPYIQRIVSFFSRIKKR